MRQDKRPCRFGIANIYAAAWTVINYVVVHRRLKSDGVRTRPLGAPSWLPAGASRGMDAVLRRTSATCLEGALIRQEWHCAHGRPVDVVIGVNTDDDFRAHAWLSTDSPRNALIYNEIHRIPATQRMTSR